jgi:hypothetical protein
MKTIWFYARSVSFRIPAELVWLAETDLIEEHEAQDSLPNTKTNTHEWATKIYNLALQTNIHTSLQGVQWKSETHRQVYTLLSRLFPITFPRLSPADIEKALIIHDFPYLLDETLEDTQCPNVVVVYSKPVSPNL